MTLAPLMRILAASALGAGLAVAAAAAALAQQAAPPVNPSVPPNFNGPHSGYDPHRGVFGAKINSAGQYVGPAGRYRRPGYLNVTPPISRMQARPSPIAHPNRGTNRVFTKFQQRLDARGRAKAAARGEASVPR